MFALAAVGLLVMVGLAIDGMTIFLERGGRQNAANATALAGRGDCPRPRAMRRSPPQAADQAIRDAIVQGKRTVIECHDIVLELHADLVRADEG